MLTPKQLQFCQEYLVDLNATQAAIRSGYSKRSAGAQAGQLLEKQEIRDEVQRLMALRAERTELSADWVVKELMAIASADPREIVEYLYTCCRYCWGKDNRYQMTPREMAISKESYEKRKSKAEEKGEPFDEFDEQGGLGYDARKAPNPECMECFGRGVGTCSIKDTSKMSDTARRLYAGVKETRFGVEVKMHDRVEALIQLGKHLGIFQENLNVDFATLSDGERASRIAAILERARQKRAGSASSG